MDSTNPKTKFVICSGPNCDKKRIHWENPETPRGPQYIEVPIDYDGPAFCSLECKMYYDARKKQNDIPQ